ncbi:alkaline phosphatase D family protein [Caulobacter segnis]|uniref:alkaline phosphatase D family protein n=1 Tax=Caulobacter segnis TaxID=88688 RepID=UPI00240F70A7|nr:alkaline phosphatase D family protein [Caulobacter segnis]MDG2519951.1 alkaline phosphatase D family protein [Caulobacter segnis]
MKINRRGALALLGFGAAAPAGAVTPPKSYAGKVSFDHGAASGDPLADRVILWTRATPADPKTAETIALRWDVASDPEFKHVVAQGQVPTDAGRDFTAKVDVAGLKPATDYWYRFRQVVAGQPQAAQVSGRTRTLPRGATKDVVLAVASCSLYPGGFFNAYGAIAALPRVDAVLHLGDYIYEYGAGPEDYGMAVGSKIGRTPQPPHEIITLSDYRTRHAHYKADPQLQAAHARAPWIVVWDDHETANDAWLGGAENHNSDKGEGDWAARKAAALKAYYEWMPIRETANGLEGAWRSFQFGDVATLLMVETRLTARSKQLDYDTDLTLVDGKPDVKAFAAKWMDPSRRMLGETQEKWLAGELAASVKSGTAWQVLGNQVVMGRVAAPNLPKTMGPEKWAALQAGLPEFVQTRLAQATALSAFDVPSNLDSWDGYPVERERLYAAFAAAKAAPIVLAGDSHTFWVNDLHDAAGKRVAAEFGASSITSPGFGDYLPQAPIGQAFVERNKEVLFCDAHAKGFVLLTLTNDSARGDLMAVSTITSPQYETRIIATYQVAPVKGGGVEKPAKI